jgi:hypothetical protein
LVTVRLSDDKVEVVFHQVPPGLPIG